MKWATADLHLGHKNIIGFSERPFVTLDGQPDVWAMFHGLLRNWNAVVAPGDEIFILGDLAFEPALATEFLRQANGQKFMVWGNHDPKKAKDREHILKHVVKAGDILETQYGDTKVVMCHYPMLRWNKSHFGSWMLHGHMHGEIEYPYPMRMIDVGVDKWKMQPVSFDLLSKVIGENPVPKHHYFREET